MMETRDESYVDVILPLAIKNEFTYLIPRELVDSVKVGCRVVVSFGKRKFLSAIVSGIHTNKPKDYTTKPITAVLDTHPLVNHFQLKLWQWISQYYMCTTGEVYKAALPAGLKLESETRLVVHSELDASTFLNIDEQLALEFLKSRETATVDELAKSIGTTNPLPVIKRMLEKKAIAIYEVVKDKYKPKTEVYIDLGGDPTDNNFLEGVYTMLSKAKKQQEAFIQYIKIYAERTKNKQPTLVHKKQFLTDNGITSSTIQSLVEKGIFVEVKREVGRLELEQTAVSSMKALNEAQQEAMDNIVGQFAEKRVVLLHGVTASGKTEIYIQLINRELERGKQVLYLLPEIALTAQIINRLKAVFGNQVGIYHSRYGDPERVEVWNNLVNTQNPLSYKIILGARSSVFLPFSNLGLVIVDEEHETSFKQFDPAPRYQARDAAVVLATMHDARVLLGTATPSVETYFNAKTHKYGLVELFKRHSLVEMPAITVVDIKDQRRKNLMHASFSSVLVEKMNAALANGEQVILFQNRRGFSPYVECTMCGTIPSCHSCDVTLTYHKWHNSLVCHYCGYTQVLHSTCHACGSPTIETRGFGTEKIEDEVGILFPGRRVARMDLDSTRAKNAFSDLITRFENREIDILVGTQMVTKGLDFENVSLVGILSADGMLNLPDFRAFERSFQLMTQVAGRAGRSSRRGEVVIQTSSPDHHIVGNVVNHDFHSMVHTQLAERQQFGYPPFTRLIRLTVRHRAQATVDAAAEVLASILKRHMGNEILGPEYPPVGKIQDVFLKNILIKLSNIHALSTNKLFIIHAIDSLSSTPNFKSVEVVINVDPY